MSEYTGQSAYEEHAANTPVFIEGVPVPRRTWEELSEVHRRFWKVKAHEANVSGKKSWS